MIALELGLVALVIAAALVVASSRDVVGAVVTFAVFSLGLAVIWTLLAAPDVALVEAAVGAGVMSVLFLIAITKTTGISLVESDATEAETEGEDGDGDGNGNPVADGDGDEGDDATEDDGRFRPIDVPALLVVLALAIPLGRGVLALPPVGAPDAPAVSTRYPDGSLTPHGYYVEQALVETGFPNAVVAVLVVYRSLDTFGELVVAFAAAVSVLVVLNREGLT